MRYAIASTDRMRPLRPAGIVGVEGPDSPPRGLIPGGTLHATERMTAWTACGVAVERLHLFDDLDWEATLVGGGRCQTCAVAIDDAR
jgi:hypothetical protein